MNPQGDGYEEQEEEAEYAYENAGEEGEHWQVRQGPGQRQPASWCARRPTPCKAGQLSFYGVYPGSRPVRQPVRQTGFQGRGSHDPLCHIPVQEGPPGEQAWPSLAGGPSSEPSGGWPAEAETAEPAARSGPAWGGGGGGAAPSSVWSAGAADVLHDLKRTACIEELRSEG